MRDDLDSENSLKSPARNAGGPKLHRDVTLINAECGEAARSR